MMTVRGKGQHSIGRGLVPAVLALVTLGAAVASAQSAVPQPIGIKMGDGRLHPSLDLDGRYDSNIGVFNVGGASASEIVLHVRPTVMYAVETPSTLVDFNGNFEYLYYTGLLSASSKQLNRFQGQALLNTSFNRDGAAEVQLGDSLLWTDRTQNPAAGVGIKSLFNDLRLAVPIHPGGRALEITPKVSWQLELFEPLLGGSGGTVVGCTATDITCNPLLVGQMNYSNVNFGLANRWKFLPKTAIVLDASFDWRTYLANQTANPQAQVLRVQAGLAGLISPHVSVTALAGYGGNFAAALNTFIGNAEVAYMFGSDSRISLGYLRTLQPVPAYGTYIDDRGYLGARAGFLGGRLMLNASLLADFITFGANARSDTGFSVNVNPTYEVASWFKVGASYTGGFKASSLASAGYVRHEAILRLTFRY